MSRPKIPTLSWRQARVASAAALTVLLTAAYLAQPADAEDPPSRTVALAPSMTMLDRPLTVDTRAAITAQASAQAAAHRQAVEKAEKAKQERQARERAEAAAAAAREHAREQARERERARQAEQRAARSAQRQQAATLAGPSTTVSGARSYARSRLSSAQYQCLSNVVSRESGWNHRATNPSSGAYGLFQALPGSKMSSAGSDWQSNPLTQMRWGLSYMNARYGSPCGAWDFWTKNRWY
ncbi:transglycosylase SLT domain-containing protein [Streptomyces sp. NPDC006265]|uniref:aggregation-promoting factor C-terminal-like domain-containing protein n=1 Tax=Streptomyces sp. NPDC006265 TaxID=3156740 RepID=UPI0033A69160